MTTMKYDVFISYSREDLLQIESFVKDIEQRANIKCWIDWTGIESGSQFEDVIVRAIDSVDIVLFFISENSINSTYAKKEISYAYNTNKRVVPIVLDGGTLRGWFLFKFGDIDYIDIHQPRQCDKLVRDLQAWCGVKGQESKPAAQSSVISTPTPTPVPAPAKTYKVGDYYNDGTKEGVVFDVWDGGKHGKIVSLDQWSLSWRSWDVRKVIEGVSHTMNGQINTDIIMSKANSEDYRAFVWCRDKGDGWYLPAIEELKKIFGDDVLFAVNSAMAKIKGARKFSDVTAYWSSTEKDAENVWCIKPTCKNIGYEDKKDNFNNYVRAVSAF